LFCKHENGHRGYATETSGLANGISQLLKMEETVQASLEPTRSYDDALTAPLTGAMDYDGRHPTVSRAEIGLDDDRLQRVLDYIAANVRSDLALEKLVAVACYSTFHFARKFTIALGVSPQRYVGRVRLKGAMVELGAGKLSLAEIALNANFSSQASFTRAFRRETGTTPNAYKRRKRSERANVRSQRAVEALSHVHW
jgi:transcriptional regulator GlxA family with amidase domain